MQPFASLFMRKIKQNEQATFTLKSRNIKKRRLTSSVPWGELLGAQAPSDPHAYANKHTAHLTHREISTKKTHRAVPDKNSSLAHTLLHIDGTGTCPFLRQTLIQSPKRPSRSRHSSRNACIGR